MIRRRDFITLLGSVAVAWPLATQAQQPDARVRRIGMLLPASADDAEFQARVGAFLQALALAGWTIGHNVRVDTRWATGNAAEVRRHAAELVTLAPDIILCHGSTTVAALQRLTYSGPIVFVSVIDPVGADLVESLSRPGGGATGFTVFEYGISGKWLELLKAIAPNVTRAAIVRDPASISGIGQFAAIQAVAPSLGIEFKAISMRNATEIERTVAAFARSGDGGLVVTASVLASAHRDLIVALARRHRLPAVYPFRYYVAGGGLMSYGPDQVDQYRLAAGYVDRVLKGEKPADLPVQAPTRYELVVNLKTAKSLGLTVPPMLLARADEVIE